MPRRTTAATVLAALLFSPASWAQALSRIERLELASAIWLEARYNFAHWDRVTVDWDSAYRATLRAAERPGTDPAFHRVLKRFVAPLNHGEVRLIPSTSLARRLGRPPLFLAAVENQPVVIHLRQTSETRLAGIVQGSVVVQVQGLPADRWIRDSVLPEISASTDEAGLALAIEHMLDGERNTTVQLGLRSPDGSMRGASLTRSVPLEEQIGPPEWREEGVATRDTGRVRIIALYQLDHGDVPYEFDRALTRGGQAPDGLVLDLRYAGGAATEVALELAARLVRRSTAAPVARQRVYWPLRRAATKDSAWTWRLTPPDTVAPRAQGPRFDGPVVMLTSPRTGGAAEILVALLSSAQRATSVGMATAGATGVTASIPLGSGLSLEVPVAGHVGAGATELAGIGLEPEERAAPTLDDLRSGRDPVLRRALELLSRATPRRP